MPRRTGSSNRWRQRQERDIYVEQANRDGWRSRAVFKLEQINAKERILRPGTRLRRPRVGAGQLEPARGAVGEAERPRHRASICSICRRSRTSSSSTATSRRRRLSRRCGCSWAARKSTLYCRIWRPTSRGTRAMDQPRSMALIEEALLFAEEVLKPGGDFLMKAFQGEGIDAFVKRARRPIRRR